MTWLVLLKYYSAICMCVFTVLIVTGYNINDTHERTVIDKAMLLLYEVI